MKPVVGRFLLVGALFLGWIGYLGYLVLTARHPVVLSRPQFLMAELTVIAEVTQDPKKSNQVKVKQVFGPQVSHEGSDADSFPEVGKEITIERLDQSQGWKKPGEYIIPLIVDKKRYEIAPVPRPLSYVPQRSSGWPKYWIYDASSNARSQMQELVSKKP